MESRQDMGTQPKNCWGKCVMDKIIYKICSNCGAELDYYHCYAPKCCPCPVCGYWEGLK